MCNHAFRFAVSLATFLFGIATTNILSLPFGAVTNTGAEAEVRRIEEKYIKAHLERDIPLLEEVLADDFTSFHGRLTKEHRLALVANPMFTVSKLATDDTSISVDGNEAWIKGTAEMSGTFRGREYSSPRYGYTRRLEFRDGGWQIVSCEFSFRRPWRWN